LGAFPYGVENAVPSRITNVRPFYQIVCRYLESGMVHSYHELLPAVQKKPRSRPGWPNDLQKHLALTLKELTGEEYKYLRGLPFD